MPDIKERAGNRRAIKRMGLYPYIVNGTWDGKAYVTGGLIVPSGMTPGLRKQMQKMLEEGYWGDELRVDLRAKGDIWSIDR